MRRGVWGVGVAQGTGLFDGLDVELLVEILRHARDCCAKCADASQTNFVSIVVDRKTVPWIEANALSADEAVSAARRRRLATP